MSRRSATFRSALLLAIAAPALLLGGCGGFTPLYAAPGVSPRLSAIEVQQPDGRLGFLMRQSLNDAFGRQGGEPSIYRLTLGNRVLRVPRGARVDNVASRYEVDLSTTYALTEIATGRLVTRGLVEVYVTYNSADQPYAGIAAQQDSERRAAEQVAQRIRLELASYFASPRPTPSAAAVTPAPVSTYSERLPAAAVQTPRERALGEPTPQGGQADVFGQTRQSTTTPQSPQTQPFDPSEEPGAIQTLPPSDQ